VSVAIVADRGLVVPVIHRADRLSFSELAVTRDKLATRARDGRLTPDEVSGGTFTLTDLGMFGVDQFNAILRPPQNAILAVGRIKERPMAVDGRLVPRPTIYLTLSADHRALDEAQAAAFLQDVVSLIEQPALLVT
jgi:pyruvate dehydrogenase E2 component (dihydrolipoamide acetyltransferase)